MIKRNTITLTGKHFVGEIEDVGADTVFVLRGLNVQKAPTKINIEGIRTMISELEEIEQTLLSIVEKPTPEVPETPVEDVTVEPTEPTDTEPTTESPDTVEEPPVE